MNILIVGPESAEGFLQQLADALPHEGHDVTCRYDLARPSNYERWANVEILVTFAVPCDRRDIESAPGLRSIIVPSLGYEGVDVEAATAAGVKVANGLVQENFESVAEAAMLFILMALYDVQAAQTRLQAGVSRTGPPLARMLKGKKVGIIGHGNIARALISRLNGWGVEILVYTRRDLGGSQIGLKQCELSTLIEESDILLPLLPLTDSTHGMLSRANLLAMKPGAILVNLSRGPIVDEAALCDPEIESHLGFIALDVFEIEPLPADSPLRERSKSILTGHEISHTQENLRALFNAAVENIIAAMTGERMPTTLN